MHVKIAVAAKVMARKMIWDRARKILVIWDIWVILEEVVKK